MRRTALALWICRCTAAPAPEPPPVAVDAGSSQPEPAPAPAPHVPAPAPTIDPEASDVVAPEWRVEELVVIGVITGDRPSALLVDPDGRGWVVRAGDALGKVEEVSAGGFQHGPGRSLFVHWHVETVTAGGIGLILEDKTIPDFQVSRRELPLKAP